MEEDDLKKRTKAFGIRVLKCIEEIPNSPSGRIVRNPLGRAGTSVGANYRAACRGRSKAEFIAKLGIVEEEADESAYWLEVIIEASLLPESRVAPLLQEAGELTAIFTASRVTATSSKKKAK